MAQIQSSKSWGEKAFTAIKMGLVAKASCFLLHLLCATCAYHVADLLAFSRAFNCVFLGGWTGACDSRDCDLPRTSSVTTWQEVHATVPSQRPSKGPVWHHPLPPSSRRCPQPIASCHARLSPITCKLSNCLSAVIQLSENLWPTSTPSPSQPQMPESNHLVRNNRLMKTSPSSGSTPHQHRCSWGKCSHSSGPHPTLLHLL